MSRHGLVSSGLGNFATQVERVHTCSTSSPGGSISPRVAEFRAGLYVASSIPCLVKIRVAKSPYQIAARMLSFPLSRDARSDGLVWPVRSVAPID